MKKIDNGQLTVENYTQQQIDDTAETIKKMEHYEMCHIWRFGKSGLIYFRTDLIASEGISLGELFRNRLYDHFGGFTPAISKSLGWH